MNIISGSHHKSKEPPKLGYFDRAELSLILNTYSRRVAAGEWRDYALDHIEGAAFFSIFRSSQELPLYTMKKTPEGQRQVVVYFARSP